MPAFTIMSGINGCVGQVPDSGGSLAAINAIGKWDLNPKSDVSEYASSATSQAMDRVAGNDDWDGNYSAFGDSPAFMPGEYFMMYGFLNATKFVSGRAIVDDLSMKLDIEGAKEIEHTVKISCAFDGVSGHELNDSGVNSGNLIDTIAMNVQSAAGCPVGIYFPGSSTIYALQDVRSVDLSIKTGNKNYHSSSTAIKDSSRGGDGIWRNWCGRVRGNLDLTCNITQYGTPDMLPQPKSIWGIRIYTQRLNGTISAAPGFLNGAGSLGGSGPGVAVQGVISENAERYWDIKWVMFQGHSGIEVDRKAANIIGATSNGGLKSVTSISGTATMGSITKPGGSSPWWPWALPRA